MKPWTASKRGISAEKRLARGWSSKELLVVLGVIFGLLMLAMMILPFFARARCCGSNRISCINNLKMIGTAYKVWAGDNEDHYPWDVSTNQGGWREYAFSRDAGRYCWSNYEVMANELGQSPPVLVCPADEKRSTATNFDATNFGNANISYFVGINAGDNYPQSLQGGDRNIGPGLDPKDDYGYSPSNNMGNSVVISTNNKTSKITWSLKLHSAKDAVGAGNLLHGDSSVQQVNGARLRTDYQPYAGVPLWSGTNEPAGTTNDYRSFSSFRLVFP